MSSLPLLHLSLQVQSVQVHSIHVQLVLVQSCRVQLFDTVLVPFTPSRGENRKFDIAPSLLYHRAFDTWLQRHSHLLTFLLPYLCFFFHISHLPHLLTFEAFCPSGHLH